MEFFLRLRLLDTNWDAIANKPIELRIDHLQHNLKTDDDGQFEQSISTNSDYSTMTFTEEGKNHNVIIPMHVGSLDPVDQKSVQIARLNNLGYFTGPVEESNDQNNDDPDKTQQFPSAIEEFQCDHDLPVNGVCEPTTQAKLVEIHGC